MHVLRHLRTNLVAYVALFVALGGASYAARPLLTGSDIQDNTIASIDVKDGDLKAVDVTTDGLTGGAIDESTLTGVDAATLGGHAVADFALAGAGGGTAKSHRWPQLTVTQENPGPLIGDTLTIGAWTVTPTCSGTGLSIAIHGPDSYSKTISYAFSFSSVQHLAQALPDLLEPAVSSSLWLNLDYAATGIPGVPAAACLVAGFGIEG